MIIDNKILITYQQRFFTLFIVINYLLYFVLLFGFSSRAPEYLNSLHIFISIYISVFLIIRFNPFRKVELYISREKLELDKRIAFSAGIFLLSTVALNNVVSNYLKQIQKILNRVKTTAGF